VNGLLAILAEVIHEEARALNEENVRILHLGSQERLPASVSNAIGDALELTKANTGLTLSVGFDYGGRGEIVAAVRQLLTNGIAPEDITEEELGRSLYLPEVPDPDLIVRTGGDQRLSNFLIWQAAYAELYFTPTLWPDFDAAEVGHAIEAYRGRQRRFGKLPKA
jgi:undecaprenyl diphosphate synthase